MIQSCRTLALALAGLVLLCAGCGKESLATFEDGTYTGSVGQTLIISGDDFTYTLMSTTLSGHYVIDGSTVTFITTKIGGQTTGLEQKATYDFTSTTNSITLTDMRDLVNGGSGIAPDTFNK